MFDHKSAPNARELAIVHPVDSFSPPKKCKNSVKNEQKVQWHVSLTLHHFDTRYDRNRGSRMRKFVSLQSANAICWRRRQLRAQQIWPTTRSDRSFDSGTHLLMMLNQSSCVRSRAAETAEWDGRRARAICRVRQVLESMKSTHQIGFWRLWTIGLDFRSVGRYSSRNKHFHWNTARTRIFF